MICEQVLEAVKLGEESPEIWDHLAGCASCRAKCESTAFVFERNESTEKRPPAALAGQGMPRWLPWLLLGLLMPIVGGLVAVAIVVKRSQAPRPPAVIAAAPAPEVTPVAQPIAKAAAPSEKHVLSVESTPAGTVYLNGKKQGPTPWRGEVPAGKVQVEVRADGYHTARKVVQVGDGELAPIVLALAARTGGGSGSGAGAGAGAGQKDDDEGDSGPGEELALRAPKPIKAAEPAPEPVRKKAAPAPEPEDEPLKPLAEPKAPEISHADDAALGGGFGYLTISCEPYAQIFLDGRDLGRTTPMSRYSVPSGKHKVTLKAKVGDGQLSFDVTVRRGQELELDKKIE